MAGALQVLALVKISGGSAVSPGLIGAVARGAPSTGCRLAFQIFPREPRKLFGKPHHPVWNHRPHRRLGDVRLYRRQACGERAVPAAMR